MRMTNKIMQNNSLYNINNNKILQDQLSTSMATQKKLTRPSDDPIIAIRALRLRTSVSELSQFLDRNAKDADAWLTVTEDALSTASSIIGGSSGMISLMTKAANKDLTPSDLDNIMQQIKSLRDEIYATANVDYAGRYIFTGYRTDTPLSFTKDVTRENYSVSYNITEQLNINSFDKTNYTDQQEVLGLSRNNYTARPGITEQDIFNSDIHRLRLSYDELTAGTRPTISYWNPTLTPPDFTEFTATPGLHYPMVSIDATPDPYQTIQIMNNGGEIGGTTYTAGTLAAVFIPETGEILFSDAAFNLLRPVINDPNIEVRVNYVKDSWKEGDLRPEHYFACTATETKDGETGTPIPYNTDYLTQNNIGNRQIIEYDVGYNQRIRINTLAEDIFRHTSDRDVDDLDRAVIELMAIQRVVDDMRAILDGLHEGTPDYVQVQKQLDAATKAYDFIRENVHQMFENGITKMQTALDAVNVAVTDSGTRSARLDLISNRLLSQKTTFEVLKSENEDADIAEVAIKLTSTELSYNAALMATGKIMQTSLMNFI